MRLRDGSVKEDDGPGVPVKGTVVSEQGEVLVGATVMVKSSKKSTITNFKGEFSFTNIPDNSVLVISYAGYAEQQIRVSQRQTNNMRIALAASKNEMDAAVIHGYYTTSKKLSTGNVSVVSGEDIRKQPVTDPLLALEGRVPGLYIEQASGVPGSYATVQLRGQNSLLTDGKPLSANDPFYIVDGVPYNSNSLTTDFIGGGIFGSPSAGYYNPQKDGRQGMSPFNYLNPADIESIEVLKDADATAIYGSRGANGVILITTKKGKAGATKIDLNVSSGFGKVTRIIPMLDTKDYLMMRKEAFKNDGLSIPANAYDINGTWDTTRYTNWQRVLNNNASPFFNSQVSMSGGSANTSFIISAGYSKQSTTFYKSFSDQKSSVDFHLKHVYQRLRVNFSGSYMNDFSNMPGVLPNFLLLAPDAPALLNSDGSINWATSGGYATWVNPVAYMLAKAKAITNAIRGSMSIGYQIVRGMDFNIDLGYNYTENKTNLLSPSSASPPPFNDAYSRVNQMSNSTTRSWIIEPQWNYNISIGQGKLSMLAGATLQESVGNSYAITGVGFSSDALIGNMSSASVINFLGSTNYQYRYIAGFGRINYNFQDKYIANVTARRDGSSRFGPNKQFGNFGALGFAWIFSKEGWFSDIPLISFGKLRGSYGVTGNDGIADYQYLSTYGNTGSSYQGVATMLPTLIANPYFQWEKVKKLEGGIEIGLLKDRISITASWYRNHTNNQLISYPLPQISGFTSVVENLPATIENKGWEFLLQTKNIVEKYFSWSTSINLSLPKSILAAFPDIKNSTVGNSYSIGKSLFSKPVYDYAGVDPMTGRYQYAAKKGSTNNNSLAAPNDFKWSDPVYASIYGGINNSIGYRSLQLDLFFTFSKKNGYNYLAYFPMPGTMNNQMEYVLDRWQKPGDKKGVQKFSTENGGLRNIYNAYMYQSNTAISDASFVRLKNVSVSYRLSEELIKRMHLYDVRLSINCQNLFTWTKYRGIDPETGSLSLPPFRMITGGLHVSF